MLGVGAATSGQAQTAAPFGSNAPALSEPHGGAAAPLPAIAPTAPPASEVEKPAPPPAAPSPTPLDSAPRFVLRGYHVDGNTVLDNASIEAVFAPYLNRPVSIADLEEIRTRLTRLYVDRGYINSGFVIPDQDASSGVVTFRAVEGRVTEVNTKGTEHFDPDYFNARLERGLSVPFNINDPAG